MIEISLEQARQFILDTQGLRTTKPCKSIIDVANRVHNIQIDTISVVARSHNLITFNRYPSYEEGTIWGAEREGKLFEYWSHAMCLMPFETFPFSVWRSQFYPGSYEAKWIAKNQSVIDEVYSHVKKNGATHSASIGEKQSPSSGWWDWKAEKMALEILFMLGKLMVAYRQGFQKFYDLTERVLPSHISSEPMSDEQAAEFLVTSTLGSLGLGCSDDIRTYHNKLPSQKLWNSRKEIIEIYLSEKVKDGYLEEVSIEGQNERYFMLAQNIQRLEQGNKIEHDDVPVKLLTPFDNILRERHFPKRIWNFDYVLECYLPVEKRQIGYFVLPILDLNELAGRVDAKVHRQEGRLEVKSLYLENDAIKTEEGLDRLHRGLHEFAEFHSCDRVTIGKVTPRKFTTKIRRSFE